MNDLTKVQLPLSAAERVTRRDDLICGLIIAVLITGAIVCLFI